MPAPLDREQQSLLPGQIDGGRDLVGVLRLDDQGRLFVDQPVPDQRGVVEARVAGSEAALVGDHLEEGQVDIDLTAVEGSEVEFLEVKRMAFPLATVPTAVCGRIEQWYVCAEEASQWQRKHWRS